MFAYGIGVLTLIKHLKVDHPDFIWPWYAGNAVALGTYEKIELYFDYLKQSGPGHGYYPEHSKRVMIVPRDNIKSKKKGLYYVIDLGFSLTRVILEVLSTTIPNLIFCMIVHCSGEKNHHQKNFRETSPRQL